MGDLTRVGAFQNPYFVGISNYQSQFVSSSSLSLGHNMSQPLNDNGVPSHSFLPPERSNSAQIDPSNIKPQKPSKKGKSGKSNIAANTAEMTQNSEPVPDAGFIATGEEFSCDQCDQKFSFRTALYEHLRAYHKVEKPYICLEAGCSLAYLKRKSLDCHLRDYHGHKINIVKRKYIRVNGKWKCDLCDKTYNDRSSMMSHRFTHFEPRFSCVYCDYKSYYNRQLQRHLNVHNVGEKRKKYKRLKYPCVKCKVVFHLKRDMLAHECGKVKPKSYKITNKKRRPILQREITDKDVLCELCGSNFNSELNLKKHIVKAHSDNPCKYCSENFTKPEELLYHLMSTHNEDAPTELVQKIAKVSNNRYGEFLCDFCCRVFNERRKFNRHTRSHLLAQLASKCPVCLTQFTSKDELKKHREDVHKDVDFAQIEPLTLPKCKKCNSTFRTEELLEKHIKEIHERASKICPYCDKDFSKKLTLVFTEHIRTHTGEKPYGCNQCQESFINIIGLKLHIQNKHLKKNPLYCWQCKILFATNEKFREHVDKEHIAKFKFTCTVCYWGANVKARVDAHFSKAHSQNASNNLGKVAYSVDRPKPFKCKFCEKQYLTMPSLKRHFNKCKFNDAKESSWGKNIKFEFPKDAEEIPVLEEFICSICFFVFENHSDCLKHFKYEHKIINPVMFKNFTMVGLNKVDSTNEYKKLDTFISNESNSIFKKAPLFCKICRVFFSTVPGFDRHLQWFHPKYKDRLFTDGVVNCRPNILRVTSDKKISRKWKISTKRHETKPKLIENEEDIFSLCSDISSDDSYECQETTSSKSNYSQFETIEPVPDFWQCKMCQKLFRCEDNLKKHCSKRHSIAEECKTSHKKKLTAQHHNCKYCFQYFYKYSYLQQHMDKHHSAKKPLLRSVRDYKPPMKNLYLCKMCKVPYTTRQGILLHFYAVHKDVKDPKSYIFIGNFSKLKKSLNESNVTNVLDEFRQVSSNSNDLKEKDARNTSSTSDNVSERRQFIDVPHEKGEVVSQPDVEIVVLDKKYVCQLCKIGWDIYKHFENHIARKHPDYYDIYPKVEPDPVYLKIVTEEAIRMMSKKNEIFQDLVSTSTPAKPKPTPREAKELKPKLCDKRRHSSTNESVNDDLPMEYSTEESNIDNEAGNHLSDTNELNVTSESSQVPSQQPSQVPQLPDQPIGGQFYNVSQQNYDSLLVPTSSMSGQNPSYNSHQLYQNYLSSFNQFPATTSHNQIFSSTASFRENQNKEFALPDWDSVLSAAPVKNQQSGHFQNINNNFQGHEEQNYPSGMVNFQNQTYNNPQDPCSTRTTLHQPYLNPIMPSTSHIPSQNYSNSILQHHLIPLANVANYQVPPTIGGKSVPRRNTIRDLEEVADFSSNNDAASESQTTSTESNTSRQFEKHFERKTDVKCSDKWISESIEENCNEVDEPVPKIPNDQQKDNSIPLTSPELEEMRKKTFFCKVCPMYYMVAKRLLAHYVSNHPDCEEYINELELKIKENVGGTSGNRVICDICQKDYVDKAGLRKHKKFVHFERKFACHLCDQTFTRKYVLLSHIQSHKDEREFQCAICLTYLKSQSSLNGHMQRKHKDKQPFPCPNCEQGFKSEKGLREHAQHLCKKCYSCSKCEATFKTSSSLLFHSYKHEDNRIKCKGCWRKFTHVRNLKRHLDKGRCSKNDDDETDKDDSQEDDSDISSEEEIPAKKRKLTESETSGSGSEEDTDAND